jgi:hypothetical protein
MLAEMAPELGVRFVPADWRVSFAGPILCNPTRDSLAWSDKWDGALIFRCHRGRPGRAMSSTPYFHLTLLVASQFWLFTREKNC